MNTMIFPEDVANVVQSYYMSNEGDSATQCLIVAMGAALLETSHDKMLEMIGEYAYD